MKKTNIYAAMIAITMVLSLASCAESAVSSDNTAETTTKTTADLSTEKVSGEKVAAGDTENADTEIKSAFTDDGDSLDIVSASFEGSTSGMLDTADMFSERDLEQTADLSEAEYITVSSNDTISITDGGVYVISGSAENCTIRVEADSQEKVQLVLDGVSITNEDFPAIYVVSADKCFITTAEGSENTLSVTGSFTADADTNTDAVIFSKDDIVFNGMGVLNISSAYGNGISGKDDVKFTGGSYNITSALDAVEANDSIRICGGTFDIISGKDGLHSENDEDDSQGYIYIAGGTFSIDAKSDAVQATTIAQIDGGSFDMTASEGIEATYVQINDGTINITASDDGINATNKSTAYDVAIEFNGGYTTIVMGQGDTDGVDANGSIIVNGGTIDVTAQMSSFDYDGTAEFNGGTIIVNGEEVSEIPVSMMGGGMGGHGGMMGGEMQEGMQGGMRGGRRGEMFSMT
ncbi:MAG: carbohydrate-binding domain-containing protein [Ruminococcus sp.]|uniref:carbohydrate-binding domain-containing protein n=1 Tax=Ruminococcus sp. TaxID=41978 RepID=UPI002600331D|nr:carbohydrate-binding domain-containing protein [Ruminococcus sp.]MBR0529287.1 carbohydrate-binding domain-containing protein [Ruminococcus sp.]